MILKHGNSIVANDVVIAETTFTKMKGLMFKSNVPKDYAMVFVFDKETTIGIHMMFVFTSLDVIFLNRIGEIIHLATLNPWIGYAKKKDTQFVIEMKKGSIRYFNLKLGDRLTLDKEDENK